MRSTCAKVATFTSHSKKCITVMITNSRLIILLAILAAFFCYSCKNSNSSQAKEPQAVIAPKEAKLTLSQDSGYIYADEALSFLLGNQLIDTTNQSEREGYFRYTYSLKLLDGDSSAVYYRYWGYSAADTIGKYYVAATNDKYIAAVYLSNIIVLLELTKEGKLTDYNIGGGHGSYACCWGSIDDMLLKYGDYFGIITCGTGSAHCSENLTLFKDKVVPLGSSIPLSIFNGSFGEDIPGQLLNSTMEFRADSTLIMHYELEEYIENEDGDKKTVSTKKFTVAYTFTGNEFITTESDKFNGIGF